MSLMRIPSPGRIVHYIDENGERLAAIVAKVCDTGVVNLRVFWPDGGHSDFEHVVYCSGGDTPGHWSWPILDPQEPVEWTQDLADEIEQRWRERDSVLDEDTEQALVAAGMFNASHNISGPLLVAKATHYPALWEIKCSCGFKIKPNPSPNQARNLAVWHLEQVEANRKYNQEHPENHYS